MKKIILLITLLVISFSTYSQEGSIRNIKTSSEKLVSRNLTGLTYRVALISPSGEIMFITNGTDGQILTMESGVPIFKDATTYVNISTQQFTGGNISHNATNGINSLVVLTSVCSTYTLSNVKDGEQGDIVVKQNATGGYGINSIVQSGLTTIYPDINNDNVGDPPNAANINSGADRWSVVSFHRVNNYLLITYGNYAQ